MRRLATAMMLIIWAGTWTLATPDRLGYQGVLRGTGGAPLNGSYDMVFRFFDAATAGNEILVNLHENSGTGSVTISNGLFQIEVGSGVMIDGSAILPGDPYTTLGAVFEDFTDIWMEIAVGQNGGYETLSPRTHITSSPYALRAQTADSANSVGGLPSGSIITTSATAQTKAGPLQVDGTLTAGGNLIGFGLGGTIESTAARITITGGNANSDDLYLRGGNSAADGAVEILGAGPINVRAGSGAVNFMNDATSAVTATLDATGQLATAGNIFAGGSFRFATGPSAAISAFDTQMQVFGGDAATDDLFLFANLNSAMGSVEIDGGSSITFRSGNGSYNFLSPAGAAVATIDAGGNIMGSGDYVFLNGGRLTNVFPNELRVIAGTDATDILRLAGGDGIGEGQIVVGGSTSGIALQSVTGVFEFLKGTGLGTQTALLDPFGNLSFNGDLTVNGDNILFNSGPHLDGASNGLFIRGGPDATDILFLSSGDGPANTQSFLNLTGDATATLASGGGNIFLQNNDTSMRAVFSPNGDFAVDGDIIVKGDSIEFDSGPHFLVTSSAMFIRGGPDATDVLFLSSGDGPANTQSFLNLTGDASATLASGGGWVTLQNNDTSVNAVLLPNGDFSVDGDLIANGNNVFIGPPPSSFLERNPGNDHLLIARDQDFNNPDSQFRIYTGTTLPVLQVRINDDVNAPAYFDGVVNANGIDYAESFLITDPTLAAGDVVTFDLARAGYISRATEAYSALIAGVISTAPGFLTGNSFTAEKEADPNLAAAVRAAYEARDFDTAISLEAILEQKKLERQRPVALAGRLPVKVDASYGPIKPGDHLTSSKTPGHAMTMTEPGPSLGVALEGWDGPGPGVVMAFVQRSNYTPPALLAQTVATQQSLASSLAARTPDPVSGVQMIPSNLQVVLDSQGGEEARFSIFRDGSPAEPRAEMFRVDEKGNVWAQGAFRPRAMDLAEMFEVSEPVEPGDVLVTDRKNPGFYARSSVSGDPAVVGVVASDPGVILGADMSRLLAAEPDLSAALAAARAGGDRLTERDVWAELEKRFHATHAAVGLSGTLKVKVDADYGAIQPGDLLIASPTPGHAMRAPSPAPEGAVIGKALESLDAGAGVIRMIVALR